MSWMTAHGMIYHCTECGSSLVIDYKDGAQPTFIGELNMLKHRALSERYAGSAVELKNALAGNYEHYFHEEAICEGCYKKINYPASMTAEFNTLFAELGSISSAISELIDFINGRKKEIINDYCSRLNFENAVDIDEKTFTEAFGSMKKPFKKAVNKFISSASQSIVSLLLDRIAFDPEVQQYYACSISKASQHRRAALSLANLCGRKYYSFTSVYSPQNLHFLFVTDQTVREPVPVSDIPVYYYYPCVFEKEKFDEILNRVDRRYIIEQIRTDKDDWVKAVKKRILEFCV